MKAPIRIARQTGNSQPEPAGSWLHRRSRDWFLASNVAPHQGMGTEPTIASEAAGGRRDLLAATSVVLQDSAAMSKSICDRRMGPTLRMI